MLLTIASRGSRLALAQSRWIADLVTGADSSVRIEIRTIATTGDKDARPFAAIGGKALFAAEVERAVATGEADIAVHSAKDLTTELASGCDLLCIPTRADPRDAVVGGAGEGGRERLAGLPAGAAVGTSSMRRRALLSEARPDLDVVALRGNLDTRLHKVAAGEVDAAVLALAGIARLDMVGEADPAPLDPDWWIPAPGQGALAIEGRSDRSDLRALFEPLDDPAARAEITLERSFAARLEGGCSVPLGCLARARGDTVTATGYLGHPDGLESRRDRASGPLTDAHALGRELAEAILQAGGDELLDEARSLAAPEIEAP